ncbi:MAG: hypothetical protein H0T42_01635 [Deltaproteobacteria bacterium]|nr:hypothetical protein [Deltaproteobacteria bacterium]
MASFVIGLRFLKFWRLSRDRFFVWFAAAFCMFSLGWVIRTFDVEASEHAHLVFLPRLAGFVMILIAIIDKNRQSSR